MNWERVEAAVVIFFFAFGAFAACIAYAGDALPATLPLPGSVFIGVAAGAAVAVAGPLSAPVARAHSSRGVPVGRTFSVWLAFGLLANLIVQSIVDAPTTGEMVLVIAAQGAAALLAPGITLSYPDLSSVTVWKATLAVVAAAVAIDLLVRP